MKRRVKSRWLATYVEKLYGLRGWLFLLGSTVGLSVDAADIGTEAVAVALDQKAVAGHALGGVDADAGPRLPIWSGDDACCALLDTGRLTCDGRGGEGEEEGGEELHFVLMELVAWSSGFWVTRRMPMVTEARNVGVK